MAVTTKPYKTWTPTSKDRGEDTPSLTPQLLGFDTTQRPLSDAIRDGFPYGVFQRLHEHLNVPQSVLADHLGISLSTLHRRKSEGSFKPIESDRLWRYLNLYSKAVDVLESEAAARHWLTTSKLALGGGIPLAAARTEIGAKEVENLLIRIEHGVFG
ncbi:type II toxin-antitoxin system antitoxin Xre [soil metagenome]|nr:DUF2384 domain-containing protein [Deinococcota bacterium]